MIYGGMRILVPIVESPQEPFFLSSDITKPFPPLPFSLSHTFTVTHWVFDKPGNGAVEMFSRRTMQIRPYPQGDTVNGFNHQQNPHRGVCVCAYARVSNKNMPPASGKQIRKLEQKINTQRAGKI